MDPVRIGVVGVGNISGIYFKNLRAFSATEVVSVADIDLERAKVVAAEQGVAQAQTVDELLANPDVEVVLNLTIPAAHGPVSLRALESGKHVYGEKPLATSRSQASALVEAAHAANLRVGCAPDTFMGAGLQTARKAIDAGLIGEPIGAQAQFLAGGPESWHPNPSFFYQQGGGPMLDMGPYYITALIHLLGPISRVSGFARPSFVERLIPLTNESFYKREDKAAFRETGEMMHVETPTHYVGALEFASGPIAQFGASFDVWRHKYDWAHPIVIFGSEGTLLVPDPNSFSGAVLVGAKGGEDWTEVDVTHGFGENSRGIGLLDMAHSIRNGGDFRANGDLAFHVLDAMLSVQEASETGTYRVLESGTARPAALAPEDYADAIPDVIAWRG